VLLIVSLLLLFLSSLSLSYDQSPLLQVCTVKEVYLLLTRLACFIQHQAKKLITTSNAFETNGVTGVTQGET